MRLHGVLWCPRRGFCPWRLPGGCISLRHGHDHGTQHRPTGAIEPEHRRRTGLAAAGDLPRHTVPGLRVRIRHVRLRVHSHVRTFAPSFGLHRRRGSRRPRRRMVRQQAVHRGGGLLTSLYSGKPKVRTVGVSRNACAPLNKDTRSGIISPGKWAKRKRYRTLPPVAPSGVCFKG